MGYGELLLRDAEHGLIKEEAGPHITTILTAAEDAARIVRRRREFYRPDEPEEPRVPVDFNQSSPRRSRSPNPGGRPTRQPRAARSRSSRNVARLVRLGRSRRAARSPHQSDLQCRRCHAAGRHDHAPHSRRPGGRRPRSPRFRHGHERRSAPALSRAVLYHQGQKRDGPRTLHGLRHLSTGITAPSTSRARRARGLPSRCGCRAQTP